MEFGELVQELKKINFEELRVNQADYFEAVIVKVELPKLTACLQQFLGPNMTSAQLPAPTLKILDEVGGLRPGQTLYFKNDGSDGMMVLLWPWKDGVRTTLKLINHV